MTDPLTDATRPPTRRGATLRALPGGGAGRAAVDPRPAWVSRVVELAVTSLGTDFAGSARRAALAVAAADPVLARGRGAGVNAATLVFLLAEHIRLFEFDPRLTRTAFARELGTTWATLGPRVTRLRPVVLPLLPDVPDPET